MPAETPLLSPAPPEAPVVYDTPPGPPPTRLGRPLPFLMKSDPTGFMSQMAREYGDVVRLRVGKINAFLLNHPDLIRDVLVTNSRLFMKGEGLQRTKRLLGEGLLTSEGDFHLKQRRLMQPMFLKARIASYAEAMGRHALRQGGGWHAGQVVDIGREMAALTLAVVGETLFATDLTGQTSEVREALDQSLQLFNRTNSPFAALLDRLPFGPAKQAQNARERLDKILYRLIDDHKATGEGQDLLSLLLGARYEDGEPTDRTQVRDEAMTIFLAGHETTANALTWTWYLLANHPEVASRMHGETANQLQGRPAEFADLDNLTYTRQVVSESMRLYPPAWIIGRRALADYDVAHEGHRYLIPKGSIVVTSQWVMHHDPRYWPEPDRFDPSRWENSESESRPKFAYFPFGAGPRQCIGEGFAWMEAILLLATLAQNWKPELMSQEPAFPQPRITLRPRDPILMKLGKW